MQHADNHFDVAVVGGGIVGLAVAYQSAVRGRRVVLFERHPRAQGATIRNFGMVWPVGQPAATFDRAMRARETWLNLSERAGFWAGPWGSLHLAYQEDELDVLEEFIATTKGVGYQCGLMTPEETTRVSGTVNPVGLKGALLSHTEVNVDPREATEAIHRYLRESLKVDIQYGKVITAIDHPRLSDGSREWQAERIFVCSGADFETLYPDIYAASGMTKCKLQMMRTVPQDREFRLGPNLAAGLTLQHYTSFAHCESLKSLKQRYASEFEAYNRWGIHVLLSQTRLGELTIGDSHEYGLDLMPFDKQFINALILDYLWRFAMIPNPTIAEYWNGIYAKLPGATEFLAEPAPGVMIVNGLSGAGMTLSFGLAEELVEEKLTVKPF